MCCAVRNVWEASALMYESFTMYHKKPFLFIFDNGSTDNTRNYLEPKANWYHISEKNVGHGGALDYMCKRVKTPYTLLVDSDVEFLGPVAERMKSENAAAVGQQKDDIFNFTYVGYKNVHFVKHLDPCCLLFETDKLQTALKYHSFEPIVALQSGEIKKFYDTGCFIYKHLIDSKEKVVNASWLRDSIHHFGGMSWMWFANKHKRIQERLALLRKSKIQIM